MASEPHPTVKTMAILSTVAAIVCLGIACVTHESAPSPPGLWRSVMIGFWLLAPPIWFFCDWCFFAKHYSVPGQERTKHTHELARNIWVAYVAVLSVALNIGPLSDAIN